MHLNREQIAELLPILQKFVETGDIKINCIFAKNKTTMKDNFLNRTSAEMLTCTEDIIAYDLGYPFSKQDYNAKLIENIVKENFESFFKFYNSDFYGIEIEDISNDDSKAIVGFIKDNQYILASYDFLLSTLNLNSDNIIEEKWNAINVACALYLKLITFDDIDKTKYSISE